MRPFNLLVYFVVAFAAGAGITTGATYGNCIELAVTTLIVVSAIAYVTSDIVIKIFHLNILRNYCVRNAVYYSKLLTNGRIKCKIRIRSNL